MNRLEKIIAVSLQVTAGVLFAAAGYLARQDDIFAVIFGVPAVAAALGGMLLWGRAVKTSTGRADEHEPITDDSLHTREVLSSLQQEVAQLREDRAFFQQLYAGRKDSAAVVGS